MSTNLMDKAYHHCIHNGHRYTKPRAHILKILAEEGKPLGAYDILKRLSLKLNNPNAQTVYRAIQFWHQEGFIHCIDSLKSYVACLHGHHIGQAQFLICNQCDFVKELDCALNFTPITEAANSIQFSMSHFTVEIKGLCSDCSSRSIVSHLIPMNCKLSAASTAEGLSISESSPRINPGKI